jgi:hypothetical protein
VIPERWEMAQEIKKHARPDSKLVTAGEYAIYYRGKCDLSPVIYYYSGLKGWSLQRGEWTDHYIQKLIKKGATHFVGMYPYGNVSKGPKFERFGNISEGPEFEQFLEYMKAHYKVLYEKIGKRPMFLVDLRQPAG